MTEFEVQTEPMITSADIYFWLTILAAIALFIWFIFYLISYIRKRRAIKRALEFACILVTVPKEAPQPGAGEAPKDFRQVLSVIEPFYAGLYSLWEKWWHKRILMGKWPWVSLEIAVINNEISFYITVSRKYLDTIEKLLLAQYPTAHLQEMPVYNIFKTNQGKVASCTMKTFKPSKIWPIRTYPELETDPLNTLTNALSKLGQESNAAIQILIRSASPNWKTSAESAAKQVSSGKSSGPNLSAGGMAKSAGSIASDLVETAKAMPKQEKAPEAPSPATPQQEMKLKALGMKSSKVGFQTVIRIVTVAPDINQAQMHCREIASSFAQYNSPLGTGFKPKFPKYNYQKKQILIGYLFRDFSTIQILHLNTEELASIWHLPNQFIETPNILWLLAKSLPVPVNLPMEGTVMGESIYRGEKKLVRIKNDDRRRHIFMIGKTGVGKTTLFANMMEQDMVEGKGCCFIDPLGDAIEDLIGKIPKKRAEDVILFDPSDTTRPIGLNMLEYQSPEQRDFLIQEAIEMFYKLFDPQKTGIVGPQWEHWFRNAALTCMSQPGGGTLIDIPRLFTDDAFRERCVATVSDPIVKAFWIQQLAKTADFHKSEMYNYFISKFGRFMTNELMRDIIGQTKSAFDFRKVMDEGKILLVNLSKGKIGEINSNLLGMIIVSKIQMAAFSRADIPEDSRRDFYLYVDEFQNFTTETFATILSEARKYHLNLAVTNQYIAQLSETIRDAVIGNAGTLIAYRIGAADAEFMAKEFPGVAETDMVNLDRYNTYVKLLIDGTPSRPFSMHGIKSPTLHNKELAILIKQLSGLKNGEDKKTVEKKILSKAKILQTSEKIPLQTADAKTMI